MIDVKSISTHCTRTEFVGTTVLDTIGLVISGIDDTLLKEMNVGMKYHALGLFSSRTGAAGQITAIDDAVKATNTEVLSIEFPRDTKGWGGHGNYIVIGGNDVSDVRHAIELGLELTKKNAGELYISESGHLEFTYSASAGAALQKAFHAVPGEAFGFMAGSPAAIGLVMADTAMKASAVNITCYMTPSIGTSHSNEVILGISGDASSGTGSPSGWTGTSDRHGKLSGDSRNTLPVIHNLICFQSKELSGHHNQTALFIILIFNLTGIHPHTVIQNSAPRCDCCSKCQHGHKEFRDLLLYKHFH